MHVPARPFLGAEGFLDEVLVELLLIHIHAPVFAIDDHPHVVRLRRRDVGPRDLTEEHRAEEGRVFVRVQQVQGAVTAERLLLVREIHRHAQGALVPFAHREVGRRPAKVNAHARVGLAIHRQLGRHLHVRVVEVRQLLLPVRVIKLEEEGTQRLRVIERHVRIRLHLGRRHLGPWRGGRFRVFHAPTTRRTPPHAPPLGPLFHDEGPCRLALFRVQPFVTVLVELLHQLRRLRVHAARTTRTAEAARPIPARREGRGTTEARPALGGWGRSRLGAQAQGQTKEEQRAGASLHHVHGRSLAPAG